MSNVEVRGRIGPDGPALLVLYTGGTFGMGQDADGSLVPLDLSEIRDHLPFLRRLPLALTVATFRDPIDSSAMGTSDWLEIADAIVAHAPGHAGVVVLHGTDTMAYTASALSFLLEGIDIPIVLTGAQRPVTELRSDGRENLVTALAIAAGHLRGAALVPEVTIFFSDLLLRGNRAVKVHADSYHGFASPNHPPLATAGVSIEFESSLDPGAECRPDPAQWRHERRRDGVAAPSRDRRVRPRCRARSARSARCRARGVRSGERPDRKLVPRSIALRRRSRRHGRRHHSMPRGQRGRWSLRTGSALLATGAVSGGDMTFEAALTKLMVLTDRHGPDEVRRLMQEDLAGELSV